MMFRCTVYGILVLSLFGCQSIPITDYTNNQPKLNPRTFFDGKLCAHGVVKNIKGKVIRTLNAQILANWHANGTATLDEVFQFKNAVSNKLSIEKRVWTLTPYKSKHQNQTQNQHKDNNGDKKTHGVVRYFATANDVVGKTLLSASGNAMHMSYTLRYELPNKVNSQGKVKTIDLQMDDWMYLVNQHTVINTTKMKKFGISVGEVVLSIQRVNDNHACF